MDEPKMIDGPAGLEQSELSSSRTRAVIPRQAKADSDKWYDGTSDTESDATSNNDDPNDDSEYEVGEEGYDTVSTDSVIMSEEEDFDDLEDLMEGAPNQNCNRNDYDSTHHGSFSPIMWHFPVPQDHDECEIIGTLDSSNLEIIAKD